jgi:ketosteroid isomerase-like protein
VVVEFVSRGTAPSGRSYELEFTEVIDLVDGKIASVKVYLDPEEVARIMD